MNSVIVLKENSRDKSLHEKWMRLFKFVKMEEVALEFHNKNTSKEEQLTKQKEALAKMAEACDHPEYLWQSARMAWDEN